MVTSIFISHSGQDIDGPLRLVEDLKRIGIKVWFDQEQIRVGDRITRKVEQGLKEATYIAIWLTRASVESGWVHTEWDTKFEPEAATGETIVLPLLAEDCDIPYFLAGKRYADFRHDYQKGLADLLAAIKVEDWESPSGMKFRLILPGAFVMGSDDGEENERPPHQVTIGRPFYMGNHVVTQAFWRELMGTKPWEGDAKVREGDNFPAVNVTWYDTQLFLDRMSERDSANSYYLPSEEEWEYAARAGTDTDFSFGDDPRDMRFFGWHRDITQGGEEYGHEVGRKRPNPWGLYDMLGNVWE